MRRLICLFTVPGEVVLDPFNGAGTTTLCAEELDRRYVGLELSSQYHQLALQRHAELGRGIDPFAKVQRTLGAKNSPVKRIGGIVYQVPKKTLQLEVKQIAGRLGRMPTKEDVKRLSKYPFEFFERYFISWGEVCAAARTTGMSEHKSSATERHRKPTQPELSFGD
jgi:site-specific DNA-methyltransferase (adenine-specific)